MTKIKISKQAGFTLIEVMIGLVIGLIAALVITQVFSTFEDKKRVTTGAADTQTNGTIGLYNIQREVQTAGYGLPILDGDPAPKNPASINNSALLCTLPLLVDDDNNTATPVVDIFPIVINDGGTSGSDSIKVGYGTAEFGGISTQLTTSGNSVSGRLDVKSNLGCDRGSIVLYVDGPGSCRSSRMVVTNNPAFDNQQLIINKTFFNINPADAAHMPQTGTSKVSCIGEFYEQVTFSVNNNQLTRTDRNGAKDIISDIVSIQAQYGLAGLKSNQITKWVSTISAPDTRNQIRAIRVAVVARSGKLEKNVVTTACNSAANTGLCTWPDSPGSPAPILDLSATPNWNYYRYRVYETIIPIRNLTFAGKVL
jgi:type IV pilus assembly protein PilW